MDAKMDSGYLTPGETLDDDYDIWRELLPEEVIGIMDQLLCHEVRSVGIPHGRPCLVKERGTTGLRLTRGDGYC